jgi:hypothetical protein
VKGVDIMATTAAKLQSSMVIRYKAGTDAYGKDIIKKQSFANVKVDSVNDDIYAVAQSLGTLLPYQINEILRSDDSSIVSE